MIAKGIDGLVQNEGKIQIIASPRLSTSDIEEIRKGYEVRTIIEKSLIREISDIEDQEDIEKLSYIARLVADGILDVKIAFLTTKNEIAMYHEKMGLITDSDGNTVAFSGSMNESENAFKDNYESFDAFCSWTNDSERVFQKQMAFKAIWEDYEPGVETIDFPEAVKNRLYEYNPDLSSKNNKSNEQKGNELDLREKKAIFLPDDFKIREYQNSAIHIWEEKGFRGIYDMATGTGKTLTALASIEYLYRKNRERLAIIIVCPYQHLVEQWVEDIVRFGIQPIIGYSASSQKNWKKNLEQAVRSFNLKVTDMFCFVTTNASFVTKKVQEQILLLGKDSLFVVDEAHNMGAANYRRYLPTAFEYRLALSATIDRHNDETGTTALTDYFGEKCIEYSLREAIDNKMLTRYFYYPVLTYLDADELEEYINLTHQLATAISKKAGKTVLSEYAKQLLIKRARVIAGTRGKLPELKKIIEPYKDDKALSGARRAQIHPVCRFQLFAVSHDDIVRKCVHAIVEGLPSHAELPCHKRNKDGCGAGGHTALDFYLVVTKGQRGNKALFLLPVQTAQSAVVFLRDTAHGKHIVFQPLAVRSKVYHRKGQQKHSLIAGLQISQKFRCVLAECNQVRGKNIRVIAGAHSLSLFLHFHFSDVRDFPLDGLNCLELIHGLNVHGHGHFRIQLQDFRQQLIRKLRCHNL